MVAGEARATVAIERTEEKHRTPERVLELVRRAVDRVGGIHHYVKTGQTVLIKPNQTVFYPAEDGVTTDPLMVTALVRLCFEAGASRVFVGDSSGGTFPTLKVMEITGMKAAAEAAGAEVIDLKQQPHRRVEIPHGLTLAFAEIPAPLLDSDVIIDAPKAKTHEHEHLTCALKNWVGTQKQEERRKHHDGGRTEKAFMDIMSVTRPHLVVVDALICGEGDGPIGNSPHWAGCILASTDPVATDVTVAQLMGIDWETLQFPKEAEKLQLGVRDPARIDIVGTPLEQVKFKAWTGHDSFSYYPFNVLVGEGVTMEGTVGHVKSILDAWVRQGIVKQLMFVRGTPTMMIGKVEDPLFEQHLKDGPYVVFDDAADPKYKNDPRVHFVPGHPVTEKALPGLLKSLGISLPGKAMMKWQQFENWGIHNMEYGTPLRKAQTIALPVGAAAVATAAVVAAWMMLPSRHPRRS